jgi:ribosomal-protein-alanine N-acetyltransferase
MTYDATTTRIGIRRPTATDEKEFVALIQASKSLHDPWVNLPDSPQRYSEYLRSRNGQTDDGFLICQRATSQIMGVINLNCIVRRLFQSTYLGYAIGAPFAHQGYMTEAIQLVSHYAFEQMKLHRLEANIQPGNAASIALVKKCGFRKEGFSPRYLMIAGEWRDHERWALLADQ